MPRYMKQRGPHNVWYFQRAVPPDVKDSVDPSLFREKSLRTSDEKQATKAARRYIVNTDEAIDRARSLKNVPSYAAKLTPIEARELEQAGGVDTLRDEVLCDVRQYRFLEAGLTMPAIVPEDFIADRISAHMRRLEGKAEAAELAELSQIIREKARTLHKLGVVVDEIKGLDTTRERSLYNVVDHWAKATNQPAQTVRQFSYAVRRFCEVNGDLAIKDLTKDHLRNFADRLPELPAKVPVAQLAAISLALLSVVALPESASGTWCAVVKGGIADG